MNANPDNLLKPIMPYRDPIVSAVAGYEDGAVTGIASLPRALSSGVCQRHLDNRGSHKD